MSLTGEKIKVVLIEDSGLMRILISDILRGDGDITLLATASNGKEGVEKAIELKPDVVVTDVIMPEYDGVYVVRQLQNQAKMPVILLSSLERGDSQIFEALQAGAFDFVDKPHDAKRIADKSYALLPLIKEAARANGKRTHHKSTNRNLHTFSQLLHYDILTIGASTGGPGAIEYILNNLPYNFAIPIVIVQHMPERFIETFSERLNGIGPLRVKVAKHGESLTAGTVYLAPGQTNLKIERNVQGTDCIFCYTKREYKEYNHPSVDCLFESVAEIFGKRALAVLLTGMGKDGAAGIKKIKEAGGYTLGQDEKSSVVFGMPKAAHELNGLHQLIGLKDVPAFIVSSLSD
jgi:two-component system, chemotaxis family, protein-glutamate methylesterase/glutaminase